MMAAVRIPVVPATGQSFAVELAGVTYGLRLTFNDEPEGGWTLDLADEDGAPIVAGLPLVTGADLLEPYPHLDFGGVLTVVNDADPDAAPGFTDLGATAHLVFEAP